MKRRRESDRDTDRFNLAICDIAYLCYVQRLVLLVLVVIMASTKTSPGTQPPTVDAFLMLVPSQVVPRLATFPSQNSAAVDGHQTSASRISALASESSASSTLPATVDGVREEPNAHRNHQRPKRPKKKNKKSGRKKNSGGNQTAVNGKSGADAGPGTQSQRKDREQTLLRTGNMPDIYWRSIPMEHVRQHPRFEPLPHPDEIDQLASLEDVRMFRQDSWQWDVLHQGRCTTSQAVAALGFLEHMTGEILNVPRSWRRGGRGAYLRLRQNALSSLEDMNKVLCEKNNGLKQGHSGSLGISGASTITHTIWTCARGNPQSDDDAAEVKEENNDIAQRRIFDAHYNVHSLSTQELHERKKLARKYSQNDFVAKSVRMAWGNSQEATALITALNYFAEHDPGFVMKEVGMCGAGFTNSTPDISPFLRIGATPDAVLVHSDGRIEALEVKNHCPFMTPHVKKGKSRRNTKRFILGDRPFSLDTTDNALFSHYVPQLMMEMLCLGDECRSAVMVRQTATKGALLLRVHRDDAWIDEMLYFLSRFQDEFVQSGNPPPPNFFLLKNETHKDDHRRYRAFLDRTLEIKSRNVEVIAHIPQEQIQRGAEKNSPLFLD